jgi:hypothetical protein
MLASGKRRETASTTKEINGVIDFAFCGLPKIGGVRMRAETVASQLGAPFFDCRKHIPKCRTLVLVKYDGECSTAIRAACERLIFDPLDVFSSWNKIDNPTLFWQWTRKRIRFDELIGTSPACVESMSLALDCPVHLLPHHADPRCHEDWYDQNGHVAYAGGKQYVAAALESIEAACRRIGRRFVGDFSRQPLGALQDAALHLNLRLPPHDGPLNRLAKPAVKAENCCACGAKMLASHHPCVTSLRPEIVTIGGDNNIEAGILVALESPPLRDPVTLDAHCQRLLRILSERKSHPI